MCKSDVLGSRSMDMAAFRKTDAAKRGLEKVLVAVSFQVNENCEATMKMFVNREETWLGMQQRACEIVENKFGLQLPYYKSCVEVPAAIPAKEKRRKSLLSKLLGSRARAATFSTLEPGTTTAFPTTDLFFEHSYVKSCIASGMMPSLSLICKPLPTISQRRRAATLSVSIL
eukprot:TRINITY_DN34235_c0_g1_i1.p1 TRINITY_DN34235_c0_g1~~TRINITY_DN34235_c0_g1_i1.p1  ORF type:complete len:192 (+),score=38.67 TRINITY_DN34235_c0_g1_i1:63-578(+)